jgi:hypothetical protein
MDCVACSFIEESYQTFEKTLNRIHLACKCSDKTYIIKLAWFSQEKNITVIIIIMMKSSQKYFKQINELSRLRLIKYVWNLSKILSLLFIIRGFYSKQLIIFRNSG